MAEQGLGYDELHGFLKDLKIEPGKRATRIKGATTGRYTQPEIIQDAYNSGKPAKIIEADVIKHCILENRTVEETAEIMNYNPRSISRIKKKVIEENLAILIFGVDAIRLDKQ